MWKVTGYSNFPRDPHIVTKGVTNARPGGWGLSMSPRGGHMDRGR